MLKRNSGSMLAGVVLVSAALAVAMVSLITSSGYEVRKGESLLLRENLRRMAEEKWTRDVLALSLNQDLTLFSSAPVTFPFGVAQTAAFPAPASLPQFAGGVYLVVTTTMTQGAGVSPRHLKLQSIVEWPPAEPLAVPPTPAPTRHERKNVEQQVEDQLVVMFPDVDPEMLEQVKAGVMEQLREMSGGDLESLDISFESNEYRGPAEVPAVNQPQDAFVMNPLSVAPLTRGPFVRMWKETYE